MDGEIEGLWLTLLSYILMCIVLVATIVYLILRGFGWLKRKFDNFVWGPKEGSEEWN